MSIEYNIAQLKLFIAKYNGKSVSDPWGLYKNQCVSLVKQFLRFNNWPMRRGNAIQWVNNGYDGYRYYKNTPSLVPTPGDMAIFQTGKYGHIGVVVSATAKSMKVVQQNDPVGSPVVIKTYNYITPKCVGFLRKM